MEVPITQFRRNLFSLIEQAQAGAEVWVTHKGKRLRIVPEAPAGDRFSRLTKMQICNPAFGDLEDPALKAEMLAEMEKAWQQDWESL